MKAEQDEAEVEVQRLVELKAKTDAIANAGGYPIQVVKGGVVVDILDASKLVKNGNGVTYEGLDYLVNEDGTLPTGFPPIEEPSVNIKDDDTKQSISSTNVQSVTPVTYSNSFDEPKGLQASVYGESLPSTGDSANSMYTILGVSLLSLTGLLGFAKRKEN